MISITCVSFSGSRVDSEDISDNQCSLPGLRVLQGIFQTGALRHVHPSTGGDVTVDAQKLNSTTTAFDAQHFLLAFEVTYILLPVRRHTDIAHALYSFVGRVVH